MLQTLWQSSSNLPNYLWHLSCILPAPGSLVSLPRFWEFLPLIPWLPILTVSTSTVHPCSAPSDPDSAQFLPREHAGSFQGWVMRTLQRNKAASSSSQSFCLSLSLLKKSAPKYANIDCETYFPFLYKRVYINTSTDIWAHVFLLQGVMRLRAAYAPGDGELVTVRVGVLPSCEAGAQKPMWIEGPVKQNCGSSDSQF